MPIRRPGAQYAVMRPSSPLAGFLCHVTSLTFSTLVKFRPHNLWRSRTLNQIRQKKRLALATMTDNPQAARTVTLIQRGCVAIAGWYVSVLAVISEISPCPPLLRRTSRQRTTVATGKHAPFSWLCSLSFRILCTSEQRQTR